MQANLENIFNYGIIPVVKIERVEDALPLGRALVKGGLPVAEVTFRTAAAEEVIKKLSSEMPELFIGAGTVLTIEQVKKAVGAGAKFVVAPGFNPTVVKYCIDNGIDIFPGVNSPSYIEAGLELGLKVFKFFPAEESGGLRLLKGMGAPYGDIKFIPTGGINQNNITNYLAFNKVLACGGSWMVKADLISGGKFDEIERLTKEAVQSMLGYEFAHLGINEENEENAMQSASLFSTMFNFKVNNGSSSVFTGPVGKELEIMKKPYLGKMGHLAISTNSIQRALFYLEKQFGVKELKETRKEKNGKLIAVYLDKNISGFAIHLLQK